MKEKPDDYARLRHILDAIAEIEAYVIGFDQQSFERDSKTRFASIKQLEIVGEATGSLTKELRAKYPEVPWRPIIALRNILVHDYYEVQSDIVWRIIEVHVPPYKMHIEQILEDLSHASFD